MLLPKRGLVKRLGELMRSDLRRQRSLFEPLANRIFSTKGRISTPIAIPLRLRWIEEPNHTGGLSSLLSQSGDSKADWRPTKCHFNHTSSNIARMVLSKVAAV